VRHKLPHTADRGRGLLETIAAVARRRPKTRESTGVLLEQQKHRDAVEVVGVQVASFGEVPLETLHAVQAVMQQARLAVVRPLERVTVVQNACEFCDPAGMLHRA
jgi:hypothetical protein